MNNDEPLLVDLSKPNERSLVLPHAPILSSQFMGWTGFFAAYFSYAQAHEVPEACTPQHVLAIADIDSSIVTESRLNGQFQRSYVASGTSLLTPANTRYWANWESGGNFLLLSLEPDFVAQLAHEAIYPDRVELLPLFSLTDPLIQQLGWSLKSELNSGNPFGRLYGDSLGVALAAHLLRNYSVHQLQFANYSQGLNHDRLHRVIDYIHTYLEQHLSLSEIAQVAGLSQYYFSQLFKQATGITVHQYVTQQRIERAKQLLKHRHLSLSDIAVRCGFADQSHFTKVFRKVVGIPPKPYREQN
jgi:AraC family transcriptional regulator